MPFIFAVEKSAKSEKPVDDRLKGHLAHLVSIRHRCNTVQASLPADFQFRGVCSRTVPCSLGLKSMIYQLAQGVTGQDAFESLPGESITKAQTDM